jgi:hypothetical protein
MWGTIRERALQVGFGLLFLFIGVYGTFGSIDRARELTRRAELFVASECTITRHEVASEHDSDGDLTFRPVVHYTLVVDGVVHSGKRIGFTSTSSSSRSYADDVLAGYPVGTRWPCWHDPGAADNVVLDRSTTQVSIFALIPLAFGLIGLAVLINAIQRKRAPRHAMALRKPRGPGKRGPLVLSTRREESFDLLISAGFALPFGVVGVMSIGMAWTSPSFGSIISALMFGAAGIGLNIWFLRCLLRTVGPRAWLRLAEPSVRLGESITLNYALRGPPLALRGQLALVGLEEARYTMGTRQETDTHEFHRSTLVELDGRTRAGTVTVTLPRRSMHSLHTEHNRIVWVIAVQAHVGPEWWPDVDEQYEFDVEPAQEPRP